MSRLSNPSINPYKDSAPEASLGGGTDMQTDSDLRSGESDTTLKSSIASQVGGDLSQRFSDSEETASDSSSEDDASNEDHHESFLSTSSDALIDGARDVGTFFKTRPYLSLGVAAVAGYFLTTSLFSSSKKSTAAKIGKRAAKRVSASARHAVSGRR